LGVITRCLEKDKTSGNAAKLDAIQANELPLLPQCVLTIHAAKLLAQRRMSSFSAS
jgi:hypothetical protein